MSDPFFVRSKDDMPRLRKWLDGIKFNCGGYTRDDKKGNPMVGLGYDWKPESDWSMPDKRGLIIVVKRDLLPEVEATVDRMKKP